MQNILVVSYIKRKLIENRDALNWNLKYIR